VTMPRIFNSAFHSRCRLALLRWLTGSPKGLVDRTRYAAPPWPIFAGDLSSPPSESSTGRGRPRLYMPAGIQDRRPPFFDARSAFGGPNVVVSPQKCSNDE
jgi:hypothetical protein